jgi:poly-gamma-glutamate capsule biosynthesis protein CapA/YwtB (metallophosphatase superfamily)
MPLAGAVVAAALVLAASAAPTPTERPGSHVRVTSRLPGWVAPGGTLAVSGWAGSSEALTLSAGDRRVASTTSGVLGRFHLVGRAPGPGRYRLLLQGGERSYALGILRVRPLRLAAVGDVTFGSGVLDAIRAHGPRYPWLSVARSLRGADVATGNLEGAVSVRGDPVPGKEFTFRGPPSALAVAAGYAGMDVFSVANNHTLDYGVTAFFDTLRHARRSRVATVGGGANLAAARRPAVVERGGLRIAFLGYSDVRPFGFTATPASPGTAPADPVMIGRDVRAARRRADVVVAWFHWGIERATAPDARQKLFAAAALNAGATIVLGAHPHVLQPVTRPDRRRLVAWSLGNFVFPAHSPGTERTGILFVDLDARGVRRHALQPARIAGVQPRLAS